MLLVCNAPAVVGEVLENWKPKVDPVRGKRVEALIPQSSAKDWQVLQNDRAYIAAQLTIAKLMA
jgi:beta-N-acetylhexosaminidase